MVTREAMQAALIAAAEAVLLAEGSAGLTVRAVTERAGVNVAAVTTAFGGRAALLEALLSRRLIGLAEGRIRLLQQVGEQRGGVREVLEAFVRPLHEVGSQEARILSGVLAALAEPSAGSRDPIELLRTDPAVTVLTATLAAVLPEIDPRVLALRVDLVVALVHATTADPGPALLAARQDLVAFLEGGLRAP